MATAGRKHCAAHIRQINIQELSRDCVPSECATLDPFAFNDTVDAIEEKAVAEDRTYN